MDATMATAATKQAAELRKQLAALDVKKRETESKLADTHATIRKAATRRGQLVESLLGLGETSARSTHREIDQLDDAIRVGERMAESLQKALAKAVQEEAALSAELQEADRQVQAEERAKGLEAFRIKLQQAIRRLSEDMDNLRAGLKAVAVLEINAIDAYGVNAQMIAEQIFAEFFQRQNNLSGQGWSLFHTQRNLQFLIRPMSRG